MAKKEKKTTKKTEKKKKPSDPFSRLTWDDLDEWAGTTIVARGRSYQRRGAVRDLALTPDGTLLARVYGTSPYVTQVTIQSRKNLESVCSCPYWTTCKHAVAVVLEYLECLKQGRAVEQAKEDDPRLEELEEYEEEFDEEEGFDEFEMGNTKKITTKTMKTSMKTMRRNWKSQGTRSAPLVRTKKALR